MLDRLICKSGKDSCNPGFLRGAPRWGFTQRRSARGWNHRGREARRGTEREGQATKARRSAKGFAQRKGEKEEGNDLEIWRCRDLGMEE